MQRNLADYGPFAAIERVLMALGKAGADRQAMHERLRQHALDAWEAVQAGTAQPAECHLRRPGIRRYLTEEIQRLPWRLFTTWGMPLDAHACSQHLGDALRESKDFRNLARSQISEVRSL